MKRREPGRSLVGAQPVSRPVAPATFGDGKAIPKRKTARSQRYLAWLRTRRCDCCGYPPPNEASHHGSRGVGIKASDLDATTLCGFTNRGPDSCHVQWETTRTLPGHPTTVEAERAIRLYQARCALEWAER